MNLLARFKKREMEGFKECVQSFEQTSKIRRGEKFLLGSLEDPIYMSWVAKNIINGEDLLKLDGNSLDIFCDEFREHYSILTKAFYKTPHLDKLLDLVSRTTQHEIKRIIEEMEERKEEVDNQNQESCQLSIVTFIRKLQKQREDFFGLNWRLPSVHVVRPFKNVLQSGMFEQFFEDGKLAIKGELKNGKRSGVWEHYFTIGKIMAKGHYDRDIKEGPWIFYYPNGKTKCMGQYANNRKIGLWKEWDMKGGDEKEVFFEESKESDQNDSHND